MLLEQQKISKIRKSTQFYRDKIRGYRSRPHISPAPSADEILLSPPRSSTPSVLTDVSGVDEEDPSTPSEHLEASTFPTYSPSTLTAPEVACLDFRYTASTSVLNYKKQNYSLVCQIACTSFLLYCEKPNYVLSED